MVTLAFCFSTFVACLLASFLPAASTDLVVIAAALAAPPRLAVPLILTSALAQMMSKSVLYLAGAGLVHLPRTRFTARVHDSLERARQYRRANNALVFASASTGLPPFYFFSIACGALRVRFSHFFVVGLVGRCVRFTVLVAVPQIAKHYQ